MSPLLVQPLLFGLEPSAVPLLSGYLEAVAPTLALAAGFLVGLGVLLGALGRES